METGRKRKNDHNRISRGKTGRWTEEGMEKDKERKRKKLDSKTERYKKLDAGNQKHVNMHSSIKIILNSSLHASG